MSSRKVVTTCHKCLALTHLFLRTKKKPLREREREGGKRKSLSLLHIFLFFHEVI